MTKRYLSLYLPLWSVNTAQKKHAVLESDNGVLVVKTVANQRTVVHFCPKAEKAGVREDMPLAVARALIPEAFVTEFDPTEEFLLLSKLARWLLRYTPLVGIDTDFLEEYKHGRYISPFSYGLILDITGTERLHKGEEHLAKKIAEKLARSRIAAKISTAPTIGAAWALSRFYSKKIVTTDANSFKDALLSLPVRALRISTETALLLHELGAHTVEDVMKLPRKSLYPRFGPLLLNRIDAAFGSAHETFQSVDVPFTWTVSKAFYTPLSNRQTIEQGVLALLKNLIADLKAIDKAAKLFVLTCDGRDQRGEPFKLHKEFSLLTGTKKFSHIASIIGPLIESMHVPGAISRITVAAKSTETDRPSQRDFAGAEERKTNANELINTFTTRIGRTGVATVSFNQSYLPERSYSFTPLKEAIARPKISDSLLPVQDRPSYFFSPPEEAMVIALLPDKPPSSLTWRNKKHKIIKGFGPERISEEWWNKPFSSDLGDRDYFKIQDSTGRWIWIYRNQLTHQWFVQGLWL